jgi:hypothetical protein
VLFVEHQFSRPTSFSSLSESFDLCSKVDLVLRHGNDATVDHIDFKSGKFGGDPLQNVMSRVAVAHSLGKTGSQLRTINVMTNCGTYDVISPEREHHRVPWTLVRETVVALATDRAWLPVSDPAICRWCEFRTICDSAAKDPDDSLPW